MSDRFEDLVGDGIRTSNSMDAIKKDSLVNHAGLRYKDLKTTLTPNYYLVWLHLLAGHTALGIIGIATVLLTREFPRLLLIIIPAAGLCFGYVHAYIQLFTHEAAHYNLIGSRRLNDFLANIFVGLLVGLDIKAYRTVHFDHHRYLGLPRDTEHTYFDPLNVRFVVECMTGARPLKVMAERKKVTREKRKRHESDVNVAANVQLIGGVLLHLLIIMGTLWFGYWTLTLAWVLGIAVLFPFFYSVRQVLEHRDELAKSTVDYRTTPHGAVNRIFGDGPLANTFGAAGFNRHLLHHWEPQLPYTRLKDLEQYLEETEAADILKSHRTTYSRVFVRLFDY